MYKYYPRRGDLNYLKKTYPQIDWQSNESEIQLVRNMTRTSCGHDLIGGYFKPTKYRACVVTKYVDDKLVLAFEFVLHVSTRIGAIIGLCTSTEHRRKGNTKDLDVAFNNLQRIFNCDLYLFVDKTNPLYDVLVKLYSDIGFESATRKTVFSKMLPTNQKVLEMIKPNYESDSD